MFRVGNHRSLLDSYPDLLLSHGSTLAWTHVVKIDLIKMLSRLIRSSWKFALIFIKVLWQHGRMIKNLGRMIKNLEPMMTFEKSWWCLKIGKLVLAKCLLSLVHAIILSLNWLLLYFSAGGVPLWWLQSENSSAPRGGCCHLPSTPPRCRCCCSYFFLEIVLSFSWFIVFFLKWSVLTFFSWPWIWWWIIDIFVKWLPRSHASMSLANCSREYENVINIQ